jgi:hypothetical protein
LPFICYSLEPWPGQPSSRCARNCVHPARRGRKDGIPGWVCVAAGDCNRAVSSDRCKRPSVTPGLAQPLTTTGQPQIVSRWGCECDNQVTPTLLRDAIKFPTDRFRKVADRYSTGSSCLGSADTDGRVRGLVGRERCT